MTRNLNVGLLGYGLGGKYFHAPFITNVPGFRLYKVRETNPQNIGHLKDTYGEIQVVADSDEILKDENVQLVVITTPNTYHYELASKALKSGKHVVVDKPFTITSSEADQLIELAGVHKRVLSVFQNRRWDSDFKTVKKVIDSNMLGDIVEYEAHFDRFRPNFSGNWREKNIAGSGMLYDLGSHLIDQALYLFGTPDQVFADLQVKRQGGEVIDSFEIILEYLRMKVTLKSGILVKERGPHFTIHGTKGSFVKFGLDVQEADLIMGKLPKGSKEWGKEPENLWGKINTQINGLNFIGNIESEPGNYTEYYSNVYNAILGIEDLIVTPHEARNTIRVIELAEQSNKERKWVKFQ